MYEIEGAESKPSQDDPQFVHETFTELRDVSNRYGYSTPGEYGSRTPEGFEDEFDDCVGETVRLARALVDEASESSPNVGDLASVAGEPEPDEPDEDLSPRVFALAAVSSQVDGLTPGPTDVDEESLDTVTRLVDESVERGDEPSNGRLVGVVSDRLQSIAPFDLGERERTTR